jgi:hypothetical protein
MRLVRLLLTAGVVASMSVVALPAHAAGTMTRGCELSSTTKNGSYTTGTLSSGLAVATDDTSPEVVCSVQTTPQPGAGVVAVRSARGLACVQSTCTGDYWVCYQSHCDGDGWICFQSHCDSGSLCYQSVCTPQTSAVASRATSLQATSVDFAAPPDSDLFACTTVRWYRGQSVVQEQSYGCTLVTA